MKNIGFIILIPFLYSCSWNNYLMNQPFADWDPAIELPETEPKSQAYSIAGEAFKMEEWLYPNGNPHIRVHYKNGTPISDTLFYENGHIDSHTKFTYNGNCNSEYDFTKYVTNFDKRGRPLWIHLVRHSCGTSERYYQYFNRKGVLEAEKYQEVHHYFIID